MTIFDRAVSSVKARGFHAPASIPDWMGEPLMMAQYARLAEEVGEVARSLRKGGDTLAEELADVVIVAAQMAHLINVDLEQAIAAKLTADESRGYLHSEELQQPFPLDIEWANGKIIKRIQLTEVDGMIAQALSDLSEEHTVRPGTITLGTIAAMLDPDTPRGA